MKIPQRTKSKTHLQLSVDEKLDIYLFNGDIIEIRERRNLGVPCAYVDIRGFSEIMKSKGIESYKIKSVWYDLNNGNVGWFEVIYISSHENLERDEIMRIGSKLPQDEWFNDWNWDICWELLTMKEYYEKKKNK